MSEKTVKVRHPNGWLVEYRRARPRSIVLLEARVLGPNGRPYNENWHPCNDADHNTAERLRPGIIEELT